ncbi:hypothetical protein U5640_08940 [Streptomyces sp. SS7]
MRRLRDLGVQPIILLPGDAPEAAQTVALDIAEVHAHALPGRPSTS